jgi:HD superfamily phosphohydrolase YqeK
MAKYTPEQIRDVSEKVYRHRLGKEDVARMLKKDETRKLQLRDRAGIYDDLVKDILTVLEI